MNDNQNVENEILISCLSNGQRLFDYRVKYITNGTQLIEINSAELEETSQISKLNKEELLDNVINTMILYGVQSDHAFKQWQRLEKENTQIVEAYQKLEAKNKDTLDKVSALIERGLITQEQYDNALNNSRME